ncbi:cytochrome b [Candidatus Pantoea formicae]|uniref:cytochrome b n=1 Tax=Candidatus Pantoea formicae TaxID=2608355 RepID=UPI003ED90AFE
MSVSTRQKPRQSYDAFSMTLHWITAFGVIFLFASAHIWEQLEKGTSLRKGLQAWHISFGILLALVMIVRPLWRFYCQRQSHLAVAPAENSALMRIMAHAVHGLLYLLLFTQVVLGFLFRWSQQEPFSFFGLFDVPTFIHVDTALRHTLAGLHNNVAWALIVLAGAHAVAALLHHYVLRDNVLRRMLPLRDSMPLREDK